MFKTKKEKKTKVKKISNVLQRVIVNVVPQSKSKNKKAFINNGFNKFQSQNRMMAELSSMPTRIKEIISNKQNDTSALMEEKFKQISISQDLMKRQILNRVEKQAMNKYLDNIASGLNKDVKDLKQGADFETGLLI